MLLGGTALMPPGPSIMDIIIISEALVVRVILVYIIVIDINNGYCD
jgi:hypothetical protein